MADTADSLRSRVKGNYALVLEGGDDVVIQGTQKGQEASILFRFFNLRETDEQILSRKPFPMNSMGEFAGGD